MRLQVFPKYLKSILTFANTLRSIASDEWRHVKWGNVISVCWIYLYKGNCNNDNNGLQKEWYKSVNELIQNFQNKEIKSLTEGSEQELTTVILTASSNCRINTLMTADASSNRMSGSLNWRPKERGKFRKIDCMGAQCFSELSVSHISRWRSVFICLRAWTKIINVSYTWQHQLSTSLSYSLLFQILETHMHLYTQQESKTMCSIGLQCSEKCSML